MPSIYFDRLPSAQKYFSSHNSFAKVARLFGLSYEDLFEIPQMDVEYKELSSCSSAEKQMVDQITNDLKVALANDFFTPLKIKPY